MTCAFQRKREELEVKSENTAEPTFPFIFFTSHTCGSIFTQVTRPRAAPAVFFYHTIKKNETIL